MPLTLHKWWIHVSIYVLCETNQWTQEITKHPSPTLKIIQFLISQYYRGLKNGEKVYIIYTWICYCEYVYTVGPRSWRPFSHSSERESGLRHYVYVYLLLYADDSTSIIIIPLTEELGV